MAALLKNNSILSTLLAQWPFAHIICPKIEIGLSGGVDSVVLTHLLSRLQNHLKFSLSAVYVHHGLSAHAQDWADFCARFCLQLNIPFRVAYVELDSGSSLGIEAEARKLRYQVYFQSEADIIALAHHQDDQVETAMLQFLRGGGPQALAAMPLLRSEQGKCLWRPLLSMTKQDMLLYAEQNGLSFVEDESNFDEGYRRNWVRHTLLPSIKSIIPDVDNHILRTIALMQDYVQIIHEVQDEDHAQLTVNGYFDCLKWCALSPARKKSSLLKFVQIQRLGTPRPESIEDFVFQLESALPGQQLCWSVPNGKVYAYQNRLYPVEQGFIPAQPELLSDINPKKMGHYRIYWQKHAQGIPRKIIEQGVVLACRQGGERIAFKNFHKTVKDCFQQQKIPPFLRQSWPLILDKNTKSCLAIVNVQVVADTASVFEIVFEVAYFP